jgi:cell division protein FtsX
MSRAMAAAERALFWALVAAVFAAVCAGLAARATYRVAEHYEADVRNYAIVSIQAPETPEAMSLALEALQGARHVRAAAVISAERVAALLQLTGAQVDQSEAPETRLIEVDLSPAGSDADVDGDLAAALAAVGVTGEILRDESGSASVAWAGRARAVALWGAVGFSILMALVVTLAARGFAARRRDMIEVMTDLGESRGKTAGKVADQAAMSGFWAGAVGALAAGGVALAVVLVLTGAQASDLARLVLPIDAAPLAAAPLFAAVAAAMGARRAAESFYDQAARLG